MGSTKVRKGPAAEIDGKSASVAAESYFERLSANANATAGIVHYSGGFSTTGWDDDARRALVGSNYLIALTDVYEGAWRTYYAPDPRWRSAARIFDLTSEEEKVEAIRRWVTKHTFELLMD